MKRRGTLISVFMCFLMMMLVMVSGCSKSNDGLTAGASVPTYSISGMGGYGGSPDAGVVVTMIDASASTISAVAGSKM